MGAVFLAALLCVSVLTPPACSVSARAEGRSFFSYVQVGGGWVSVLGLMNMFKNSMGSSFCSVASASSSSWMRGWLRHRITFFYTFC